MPHLWEDFKRNLIMAKQRKHIIEIEFNDDAELGTAVLFFQKLCIVLAKFGLTYFSRATLRQDYTTLMTYETDTRMVSAIKEFQEEQLAKRMAAQKDAQQIARDTENPEDAKVF